MSIKVQGQVVITDDKKGLFDKVNPGSYTTVERDALTPAVGDIVYNSQDEELQVWNGTEWGSAGSGSGGIGTPVDVLTPLDGAGVGGATNYTPETSAVTSDNVYLKYGRSTSGLNSNIWPTRFAKSADGSTLVFGGDNATYGGIWYSLDNGLNWTQANTNSVKYFTQVIWAGTRFVASHTLGIFYSDDGISWTAANLPGNSGGSYISITDLAYSPTLDRVVACNSASQNQYAIFYSSDNGASWNGVNESPSTMTAVQRTRSQVEWGNGRFVATALNGGEFPMYSTNGYTWYRAPNDTPSYDCISLIFNDDNNTFYALHKNGWLHTTTNGANWNSTRFDNSGSYYLEDNSRNGFAYDNGVYYMVRRSGGPWLQYTTDFTNWTTIAINGSHGSQARSLTFFDGDDDLYTFTYSGNWGAGIYRGRADQGFGTPILDSNTSVAMAWQEINFENSNVFNFDTGEIISDVDFVTAFNNVVVNTRTNSAVSLSGAEITPGQFGILVGTSSLDVQPGDTYKLNAELTQYGPSPNDVQFTSSNSGTAPYNGTDATLAYRTWTLETRASDSDPWTVVITADDYDPVPSQDGATPWSGKPTLAADTQYRVKVEYHSANARSVESDYNYFTTGPS